MQLTDRTRRRIGLVLFIAGAVVIFANAFGEEVYGWGFVPLGAIGAGTSGLGFVWWRGIGRTRSG